MTCRCLVCLTWVLLVCLHLVYRYLSFKVFISSIPLLQKVAWLVLVPVCNLKPACLAWSIAACLVGCLSLLLVCCQRPLASRRLACPAWACLACPTWLVAVWPVLPSLSRLAFCSPRLACRCLSFKVCLIWFVACPSAFSTSAYRLSLPGLLPVSVYRLPPCRLPPVLKTLAACLPAACPTCPCLRLPACPTCLACDSPPATPPATCIAYPRLDLSSSPTTYSHPPPTDSTNRLACLHRLLGLLFCLNWPISLHLSPPSFQAISVLPVYKAPVLSAVWPSTCHLACHHLSVVAWHPVCCLACPWPVATVSACLVCLQGV